MKLYSNIIFRFVAVIAVLNVLLGCSLTHTLKSADIPQLQVGSPLKIVTPLTFAFKEFKGGGNKDDLIGDFGIHKYKLDQPVATVIAKAIRKEFERNGHTCIAESTSKADFVVDGTVYKYFLTMESTFFSGYVNGNVATKLNITSNHGDKKEFTKNFEGKYRLAGGEGSAGVTEDVSQQALLEMVKEISRDPELIEFLQSNMIMEEPKKHL